MGIAQVGIHRVSEELNKQPLQHIGFVDHRGGSGHHGSTAAGNCRKDRTSCSGGSGDGSGHLCDDERDHVGPSKRSIDEILVSSNVFLNFRKISLSLSGLDDAAMGLLPPTPPVIL